MSSFDDFGPIAQKAPPGRSAIRLLAWAFVACAFVLGSGAVRWWQAKRVEATMFSGLHDRRFALDQIALTLGDWSGSRTKIDERIVAATGSDDLITRHYIDSRTGVGVDVIILFGPASDIFIHTPQLCYPKAGYDSQGEVVDRSFDCGGTPATFRSVAYSKGGGAIGRESQGVYFAWRYNGRWTPAVGTPKQLERIPGMYKVQVSRRLSPLEARGDSIDPCESFLKVLIPDLESRIRGEAALPSAPSP